MNIWLILLVIGWPFLMLLDIAIFADRYTKEDIKESLRVYLGILFVCILFSFYLSKSKVQEEFDMRDAIDYGIERCLDDNPKYSYKKCKILSIEGYHAEIEAENEYKYDKHVAAGGDP